MSLLDNIRVANNANLTDYAPFTIDKQLVGLLRYDLVPILQSHGLVLIQHKQSYDWQSHRNLEENSTHLAEIIERLEKSGYVYGRRNEYYPLSLNAQNPPKALIERAAMPLFGACGYGVHLNGLVKKDNNIYMWLGKRAVDKITYPNMLDNIAAGGQPYGISPFANLQKEAQEEANIPHELSQQATPVGMASYYHAVKNGIRADAMYLYDLWLPPEFIPTNTDGEVAEFYCYRLTDIIAQLRQVGHNIKYNSALAILDCAIRYGIITPDEPDYQAICHGLRAQQQSILFNVQTS